MWKIKVFESAATRPWVGY